MFRRARYPRVSSDKIFIYVYDVIVLRITVEIYLQFEVNCPPSFLVLQVPNVSLVFLQLLIY